MRKDHHILTRWCNWLLPRLQGSTSSQHSLVGGVLYLQSMVGTIPMVPLPVAVLYTVQFVGVLHRRQKVHLHLTPPLAPPSHPNKVFFQPFTKLVMSQRVPCPSTVLSCSHSLFYQRANGWRGWTTNLSDTLLYAYSNSSNRFIINTDINLR